MAIQTKDSLSKSSFETTIILLLVRLSCHAGTDEAALGAFWRLYRLENLTLVDLTGAVEDTHDILAQASSSPTLAALITTLYDGWFAVEHPRSGNALRVPKLRKKDGRRIFFIVHHHHLASSRERLRWHRLTGPLVFHAPPLRFLQ